jgi:hypothetical protein
MEVKNGDRLIEAKQTPPQAVVPFVLQAAVVLQSSGHDPGICPERIGAPPDGRGSEDPMPEKTLMAPEWNKCVCGKAGWSVHGDFATSVSAT